MLHVAVSVREVRVLPEDGVLDREAHEAVASVARARGTVLAPSLAAKRVQPGVVGNQDGLRGAGLRGVGVG